MTHNYHDELPGFHPDQIWFDGCLECESRSKNIPYSLGTLDDERFAKAWLRAADWNNDDPDVCHTISKAEMPLLEYLWSYQMITQRIKRLEMEIFAS